MTTTTRERFEKKFPNLVGFNVRGDKHTANDLLSFIESECQIREDETLRKVKTLWKKALKKRDGTPQGLLDTLEAFETSITNQSITKI